MNADDLATIIFHLCANSQDREAKLEDELVKYDIVASQRDDLRTRVQALFAKYPPPAASDRLFWESARVMRLLSEAEADIETILPDTHGADREDLSVTLSMLKVARDHVQLLQHRLGPPPDETASAIKSGNAEFPIFIKS